MTLWLDGHMSMKFSRQEYWSGLPFPPPEDLPNPGIKLGSPALAGRFFTTEPPGKPAVHHSIMWLLKKKRQKKKPYIAKIFWFSLILKFVFSSCVTLESYQLLGLTLPLVVALSWPRHGAIGHRLHRLESPRGGPSPRSPCPLPRRVLVMSKGQEAFLMRLFCCC